jgi:tRNA (guanine37-N1)-methyltransferase
MRFDIITIFPDLFAGVLGCGILQRAQKAGLVEIQVVNLRDFTSDKHRSVDDRPYGGGEGMVFMPGPLSAAIEHCTGESKAPGTKVVLLSPQGKQWSQDMALEFSTIPHAILICGRYEGVDQRIVDCLVDREISIGDFVLTGGEIPAMAILDSVVRLIPGALGKRESALNESFSTGLLDYPQYTRPHDFRGHSVPEVLLSGDHARIQEWRKEKALERTMRSRPDMIKKSGS